MNQKEGVQHINVLHPFFFQFLSIPIPLSRTSLVFSLEMIDQLEESLALRTIHPYFHRREVEHHKIRIIAGAPYLSPIITSLARNSPLTVTPKTSFPPPHIQGYIFFAAKFGAETIAPRCCEQYRPRDYLQQPSPQPSPHEE